MKTLSVKNPVFQSVLVSAALAVTSHSAMATWVLLDDFDSYPIGQTTDATGGAWVGEFSGTANSQIVSSDQGNALETKGGAAWRGGKADLKQWNAGVGVGVSATFFFQMKAVGSGTFDIMTGITGSVGNIGMTDAWQHFAAMPFLSTVGGQLAYRMSDAGLTGDIIFAAETDVWYNIWLQVDNDAETFSVYYSVGKDNLDNGTYGGTATGFRNGFTETPLEAIGFMAAGQEGTSLLVDNIYYFAGLDSSNPSLIPEPSVALLSGLALCGLLRRKR